MTTPLQFGLIGHPLGHSFSQSYFTEKFMKENICAEYLNFDIPLNTDLPSEIDRLIKSHPTLQGFNVTIPYKQKIMPLMGSVSEGAREIGAVNVVKIEHARQHQSNAVPYTLHGYNTDVTGFRESIRPFLPQEASTALVLGSGGASRAVCHGLRQLGITPTVVSRHPAKHQLSYAEITPEILKSHPVIVNATPLGTFPDIDTCPDLPYDCISTRNICYDLVYNPRLTQFLRLAKEHGATICNGLAMLHIQADEAWRIWME